MARILIVDDNDLVRRALELVVFALGHHVQATGDPREALRWAAGSPPDLALLDIRMPGMSGVDLLTAMGEALGGRCPPVVFISAEPPFGLPPAVSERAVAHIKKPFRLRELRRAIAAALAAGTGKPSAEK